jgi:hypothetical protein
MPWILLRSDENAGEFITSDTGLAMFDPHPRYPWTGNSLMSSSTCANHDPAHADRLSGVAG